MREISIQIPTLESEQNVEIDVRINGRNKTMKYRVEIVDSEEFMKSEGTTIETLRRVIGEHEKDWELIQIGAPVKDNIPIMFRKRTSIHD